jgi:hypothetical protein
MILGSANVLLVGILCTITASSSREHADLGSLTAPKIDCTHFSLLHVLPDSLFECLGMEFLLDDIPELVKISKSILKRVESLNIIQRHLATKYQLPSLKTLAFHSDLLKIDAPFLDGNSKSLCPKSLHRRFESDFEPSPLVDQVLLLLYDHFAEHRPQNLYLNGVKLAKYVFQLILTNRPLSFYDRVKRLLAKHEAFLCFKNVPNISMLMAHWFTNEPETVIRFLSDPDSVWTRDLFLAFMKIPGMKLPTCFSLETVKSFVRVLESLMLDPEYNEPRWDLNIYNFWSDYFAAESIVGSELEIKFNIRFNLYFNCEPIEKFTGFDQRVLAALLVYGGKYDRASDLFSSGLQIDHHMKSLFIGRPDFCFYLISFSSRMYRSYFAELPKEIYTSPKGFELVLAFHRVNSVDELFRFNVLNCSNCLKLMKFAIRFGTVRNFRYALFEEAKSRRNDLDLLNDIVEFRGESEELWDFLKQLLQETTAIYGQKIHLSASSVKILLARPEVLMRLEPWPQIKIEDDEFRHVTSQPEFRDAPEEIKTMLKQMRLS